MKPGYPANYFDPVDGDNLVQCELCGEWKNHQDFGSIEDVPCLVHVSICQGICVDCLDAEDEN